MNTIWKFESNPILLKPQVRWSIILRLVMTVSLLSPFLRVHHIHAAEDVESGINILQIVEVNDNDGHPHDEPESSHTRDHTHTFDNHTDWKLFRQQFNNSSISNDDFISPSGQDTRNKQRPITRFQLGEPPIPGVLKVFTSIIRGPPTLS